MYKRLIQAVTWNSINVFLYKSILLLHQLILFYFVPNSLYGTSGSIFAAIYFFIGLTNFGFEYTLYPFFSKFNQTKESFKQLIPHIATRVAIICLSAFIIWLFLQKSSNSQIVSFFMYHIPHSLIGYLVVIFITESLKKSLDTIAQLAFLNKAVAKIQISMILTYVVIFWISYLAYQSITLHTIFLPMVIISIFELLLLSYVLRLHYNSLPSVKSEYEKISYFGFFHEQAYNYINQVTKNIFSPNFLLLFIAYHIGMSQTGSVRFFTNIITLLYMFLNRAVGVPSGALFSQLKTTSVNKVRNIFLDITNYYIQFLYVAATVVVMIIVTQIQKQSVAQDITMHISLFVVAGFLEYITLTYEKLYINQNKSALLAYCSLSSLLCAYFAILLFKPTVSLILLPLVIVRLISSYIIGYIAYRIWGILPHLYAKRYTVYTCLFVSTIILFLS